MKQRPTVLLVTSLAIALAIAAIQLGAQTPEKKNLTYEQAFTGRFGPPADDAPDDGIFLRLPNIAGWQDDTHYLETRRDPADKVRKQFAISVVDGSAKVAVDNSAVEKLLPKGFILRDAEDQTGDNNAYVFSQDGDLYYFRPGNKDKTFKRLTATPGEEQNAKFSPNGKWIAYTRDHNLFAYDLEGGVEHQYTTDGSDVIYNGWASWVYYEEILNRSSQYAAFWWSPDSNRLAFLRFDDSPVPVFPLYHVGGQHGELERQRYPKAGDPNPYVQMGVVGVQEGKVAWMDFDPKADHYLAWPFWTLDSKTLFVQWMNRGQDTVIFYACDPTTGKKTPTYEEKQSSWVDFFEDVHLLANNGGFIVRSSKDGWEHLYLHNMDGTLRTRLTSGNWRVSSLVGVDEKSGWVYFMGSPNKSWDSQLMRVKLDGTGQQILTPAEGSHRVMLSPKCGYFIDTWSTISEPGAMALYTTDGKLVRNIAQQRNPKMDAINWGKAEIFTIPSGDGFDLPASWVLPPNMDPKGEYPVIVSIYGGPDSGMVRNSWQGLNPNYWAERGVIFFKIDHRGSGHFGKKGVALMHRNLGKYEMADYIAATKWLRSQPFVAKDRIGITGGSYGGYVTMMALTYGAEYFNYGQASSGVSDWQLYDSVYTERYNDTPQENPDGYKAGAVLTYADRYKGGLRITHGTIDDNVHMQNSLQVVDWLTAHNKNFELMLYPGSRHGEQRSQRPHSTRESHDFWIRTLLRGKGELAPIVAPPSPRPQA